MNIVDELGGNLFGDVDFYSDSDVYGRLLYLLDTMQITLPAFIAVKIPYVGELKNSKALWSPLVAEHYKIGSKYGKGTVEEVQQLLFETVGDEFKDFDSQGRFITYLNSLVHGLFETNVEKQISEVESREIEKFNSGFGLIDRVVGGFYQGIWTVAGNPGSGKTSVLLSLCSHLAKQYSIWYFQTEIPAPIIESRISLLNPQEWHKESKLHAGNYSSASILESCLKEPDHNRIVVYDSPEIKSTSLDDLQYWEQTYQELVQIKSVSRMVLVTSQIKQNLDWNDLGVYSLSGSASKARYSDGIIYLSNFAGSLMVKVAKNRFGTLGNGIGKFNFETMQVEQDNLGDLWE